MIAGGLAVGPLYPAVRKWLTGDGSTPPTQTEVHNPFPTLTGATVNQMTGVIAMNNILDFGKTMITRCATSQFMRNIAFYVNVNLTNDTM